MSSRRKSRSHSSGSEWSTSSANRKRKDKRRTWSRETSPTKEEENRGLVVLEPEKLVRSAKEIQRHVQKKLEEAEEERRKKEEAGELLNNSAHSNGKKRSASVDSSKFQSPKRALKSTTPDLIN
jgi:hypothetical protein